MKKLSIFIVSLMIIVFLAAVESQAGGIGKRYSRQQDRIEDGIAKGEITRRDGHLSNIERIRLERRQDLASRHVYRYKNNGMERRDSHYYDNDHISYNRSTVLVPLILPPFPPPQLIFPGIHILFH